MDITTKSGKFLAEIKSTTATTKAPSGSFEAVLSVPTLDRDGEVVDALAFSPLPSHITIDVDHAMTVEKTIGSGRPFYDGEVLKFEGTYASHPLAQMVRSLVDEGHIRTMSVAYMNANYEIDETDNKPHLRSAELLNAGIVGIPANREALITASKSLAADIAEVGGAEVVVAAPQKSVQTAQIPTATNPETPAAEAAVEQTAAEAADKSPAAVDVALVKARAIADLATLSLIPERHPTSTPPTTTGDHHAPKEAQNIMSTTTTRTPREQLEKLIPELVEFTEKAIGKEGGASAEDRETIEKMGADVGSLMATVKTAATVNGQVDVAKAFLGELAGSTVTPADLQAQAELAGQSGIVNPKGMTLGEAFIKSPAYQEFVARNAGPDGAIPKELAVGRAAGFQVASAKALITGLSDTSAGAFVTTDRLGVTADLIGERRTYVRDLCTNITIQSDTFDFVTVTGKTNAAAPVLEATTSATPGLNNVAVGAYTAAHGLKPESAMTFAVVSAIVETIAHMIPITRRAAADGGQVMQMVNAFLLYGLKEEEEDQILNGSGTTPNLRGILQTVGINTVGSAGTDIDAIVAGIAAIREDRREPTAMVIHPNDWYSTGFLLAKTGDGTNSSAHYLIGDPRATLDQLNTLWGLRVVVTPAMTENTVLIGDFKQYVVADREQAAIYVSDSHNDWFQRNLLALLAEERIAGGCLDPEAFCTVTAV